MRALLIANANDLDAGFIGHRFRHHGFAFVECHREHPEEWPSLDGVDLVLMLGSEWSVYWPELAHPVAAESALIQEADRRGTPQFGICYGSQIMAHALGGTVERAREAEIGWYDVVSDIPEHIATGPWMQWHYDVVTVPPGAEELARSSAGPQAWRLRKNLVTQFHPEATETIVARWVTSGAAELQRIGSSPHQLVGETRNAVGDSRKHAEHLVDWFLDSL